jgi:hypothetical protein
MQIISKATTSKTLCILSKAVYPSRGGILIELSKTPSGVFFIVNCYICRETLNF